MEFDQIETFLTVTKVKSFEKAAKLLHITQPAVSLRISKLESELNADLLVRGGQTTRLTEIGEVFKKQAEQMISLRNSSIENIRHMVARESSFLEIDTTTRIGTYILPKLLHNFQQHFPEVNVKVKIKDTEQIKEETKSGLVHFALINSYIDDKRYENIPLFKEPIVLFCSPDHPLARLAATNDKLSVHDIEHLTIINFSHSLSYYRPLMKLLNDLNVYPKSNIWVNNIEAMKLMTIKNLGISFLPRMIVEQELNEHKLVEIPLEEGNLLVRETVIIYKKKKHHPQLIDQFIHLSKMIYN